MTWTRFGWILVLMGCAPHVASVSNTRREVLRWRWVGDGIACPEPVGPATRLSDTSVDVRGSQGDVEVGLGVENTQSLGKIYDVSDSVQFGQYALFTLCASAANGPAVVRTGGGDGKTAG